MCLLGRYRKVKLEIFIKKWKRKQVNIIFPRGENLQSSGKVLWEQKEKKPNMTWMVEVKQQLSQKVNVVNKLVVMNEELMKVVA